ncbi:5'/3'-nucleotidase SurE [Corynebacterium sp. AOP40-9SA-29]|uniref:5'/3'-nucleotidase SurE n=1 Tax=Corynebacterium sp. AOP40-9SA-29 TaxID=3457677 RepID=UPI0040334B52
MTNDDSMQASNSRNSDGLGLYEMRKHLCEAGADVVVVAPWAVQSGRGTSVTNSGSFTAQDASIPNEYIDDCSTAGAGGAVFGLCLDDSTCSEASESATPTDTVKFALRSGLADLVDWADGPDMVVAGPNAGLNLASSVTDSGTLGAAIAGIENHVPSFAFSTGSGADGAYPRENYSATASWAVEFLEELGSQGLTSHHDFVTSVNYPDSSEGQVGEARFVEVGSAAFAYHYYTKSGDRTYSIDHEVCDDKPLCVEEKEDADWEAVYNDGAIGVGAITSDRTYSPQEPTSVELDRLKEMVSESAPAPVI